MWSVLAFGLVWGAELRPLVIGHRGSPGHLPDHTLEGYALAVEQGADFIEPDLVVTRDGVLIARHENDLTHTTDVSSRFPERKTTKTVDGVVVEGWFAEDFSLEEVRTLRAVQPYASRPHEYDGRYAIPTFVEILALRERLTAETGREIGVYPETKHPTYFRELGLPLEGRLAATLVAFGLASEQSPVFLQSFELKNLEAFPLPIKKILLVWNPEDTPYGDRRTYGSLLADLPTLRKAVHGLGVHKDALWDENGPTGMLEKAHGAGLAVHVYTFRMEADKLGPAAEGDPRLELSRFFELGVDGVFADYPDVASEVRAKRSP